MELIRELLDRSGYEYEWIRHERPIRSAREGADYFGIDAGQTAPTLILSADRGYVALTVAGDRGPIDFAALAERLESSSVCLAPPKEVKRATGFEAGSVPMIGHSLPAVVDRRQLHYSAVYGGTGDPLATLKIDPRALLSLNEVLLVID